VPELHRRALEGAEVESAKAQGRVIVVDFFAKYCEPCRRSLPMLQRFHRDEPEVLVVGIGEDESESDVREMVSTYGLTFDVIHDRGQALSGRFRVKDLPMTFVIGPEGSVRWAGGEVSEGDLGRVVAAARRPRE
jgi:thiol-disulfide isomerase/thioredoxin